MFFEPGELLKDAVATALHVAGVVGGGVRVPGVMGGYHGAD